MTTIRSLTCIGALGLALLASAISSVGADSATDRKTIEEDLQRAHAAFLYEDLTEAQTIVRSAREKLDAWAEPDKKDETFSRLSAQIDLLTARILTLQEAIPEASAALINVCANYEALQKKHPDDAELAIETAQCFLQAAQVYEAIDQDNKKDELHAKALALLEASLSIHPEDLNTQRHLANTLLFKGIGNRNIVQIGEALPVFKRAASMLSEVAEKQPDDLEIETELALAYLDLGVSHSCIPDVAETRAALNRSLALWNDLALKLPYFDAVPWNKAKCHNVLAGLERDAKNSAEAIRHYEQSQAIYTKLLARDPSDITLKDILAGGLLSMGVVANMANDLKAARQYLEESLAAHIELATEFPDESEADEMISHIHRLLGDVASAANDWPQALASYGASLTKQEEDTDLSEDYSIQELTRLWQEVAEKAKSHGDTAFLKKAHIRIIELLEIKFRVTDDRNEAYEALINGHLAAADFAEKTKDQIGQTRFLRRALELFDQMHAQGTQLDMDELEQAMKQARQKLKALPKAP